MINGHHWSHNVYTLQTVNFKGMNVSTIQSKILKFTMMIKSSKNIQLLLQQYLLKVKNTNIVIILSTDFLQNFIITLPDKLLQFFTYNLVWQEHCLIAKEYIHCTSSHMWSYKQYLVSYLYFTRRSVSWDSEWGARISAGSKCSSSRSSSSRQGPSSNAS
jgi:hypothetical protein